MKDRSPAFKETEASLHKVSITRGAVEDRYRTSVQRGLCTRCCNMFANLGNQQVRKPCCTGKVRLRTP